MCDMLYAAVDLGSNSFHLLIARRERGGLRTVLHLRETVRLAGGMDASGRLAPQAQARALDCLARFAGRLGEYPVERVHAVGTNALRAARDNGAFLRQAERTLGCQIEVITGAEEARLIYLSVVHELGLEPGTRTLVLDIGGGSTELVVGDGHEILLCESVAAGCVGLSERHFPGGKLSPDAVDAATAEARSVLAPVAARCVETGWARAVATSGTAHAVRDVLVHDDGPGHPGIPLDGLERLRVRLGGHAHIDELDLNGLSGDRRPILPGGVAILSAACALLDVSRLEVAEHALRNGLLHDRFHEPVIKLTS